MAVRRAGARARRALKSTAAAAPSSEAERIASLSPDDKSYYNGMSQNDIIAAKKRESFEAGGLARAAGEGGFSTPSDMVTGEDEGFTDPGVPSEMSEGPLTAPTTYGEMPKPGPQRPVKKVKPGPAARKKKLQKRIARTTGTTVGEARGIMRKARKQVRTGNRKAAKRTITRALSGGPKAGVPGSPQRSKKAAAAATKITKRIATRQAQAAPKRRKK